MHRGLLLWFIAFTNLGSLLWNSAFFIYHRITYISKKSKDSDLIYFWKNSSTIYYGICGPQFIQIVSCWWTLKLFSNKVTNQKWLPLTKPCYKSKRTVNQLSENSLLPERFLIVPSLSVVKIIITLNNFSVRSSCVI